LQLVDIICSHKDPQKKLATAPLRSFPRYFKYNNSDHVVASSCSETARTYGIMETVLAAVPGANCKYEVSESKMINPDRKLINILNYAGLVVLFP
jgi:hypothetical protein